MIKSPMEAESHKLGCNSQLWRFIMSRDLSVMTLFICDHFLLSHCWETSFSKHRVSPFLSSRLATPAFSYLLSLYFGTVPKASVWSLWRSPDHQCLTLLFLRVYITLVCVSPESQDIGENLLVLIEMKFDFCFLL